MKKAIALVLVLLFVSVFAYSTVQAGGCSDWKVSKKGRKYCTDERCPGGFHTRSYIPTTYSQKCIRNNGEIYFRTKSKDVFYACDCTN